MKTGRQFGRYRVQSRLGVGGMGEVYLAAASGPDGMERSVAIKVVRDIEGARQQLDAFFLEEAKVSFLLNHPNVVQTYDVGRTDGFYFLVLEYVDGTSLATLLAQLRREGEALSLPFALYICSQVARGLHYAHELQQQGRPLEVVHRDVSPANVLISRRGQVKVSDFGLATSSLRSTRSDGGIKGKVAYMAPEQLRAEPADSRADIFALGVVLYECIFGETPFGEASQVTIPTRMGALDTPPVIPSTIAPPLRELLATCMAPQPDDRFASAREVARLLDENQRQLGGEASDFELAELVTEVIANKERAPAHPFDQILGIELERDEAQGADTFLAQTPALEGPAPEQPSLPGSPSVPPLASDLVGTPVSMQSSGPLAREAVETGVPARGGQKSRRNLVWMAAILAALSGVVVAIVMPWGQSSSPVVHDPSVGADQGARPMPVDSRRASPLDAAPAKLARLVLRSSPSAARVILDGKPMGVTPLTLDQLESKPMMLEVRLAGYRIYRQRIELMAGTTLTLRPRLTRRISRLARRKSSRPMGRLSVNSEPWAVIYLDGRRIRNTPLIHHPLRAGRYQLVLVNPPTKRRRSQQVTIRAGKTTRISVVLPR